MSDSVNTEIDFQDPAVLEKAFGNANIRTLALNSDEFKAALSEPEGKMDEEDDVPADDEIEQDEETEDSDEHKPTSKKPRGMLKRIEKLVAEKRDLERALEAARDAKVKETNDYVDEQTASQFDAPKPKFADFDSLEEYTEALTEWKLDKREADRNAAAQAEALKKQAKNFAETWEQREKVAKQEYTDYSEVVNLGNLNAAGPSQEARVFLVESEFGPQVVYELLADEDLATRFADASPTQQVKMLTKLEAKFEGTEPVKKSNNSTASKAPPPPRTLPKVKATASGKDLIQHGAEMSDAEWLRAADEYARNKRRK